MLKSKIAKVTVAGGIALSTLGIGAGVANADPVAPQPAPTQTQQNPNHDKQNPRISSPLDTASGCSACGFRCPDHPGSFARGVRD